MEDLPGPDDFDGNDDEIEFFRAATTNLVLMLAHETKHTPESLYAEIWDWYEEDYAPPDDDEEDEE